MAPPNLHVMAWHDQPKLRNHPDVLAYMEDLTPEQLRLVKEMRDLVQSMDPEVVECLAWGVPFWFRKGPLCYASAAKAHVTLGIARGIEVDDPTGQLKGTGKSPICKATVRLTKPFPEGDARNWLEQAIRLDELGED